MKKQTLLVVDDDTTFNNLLRRQIETMGFNAVGAGSWAEAQTKLGEIEPDAIILDFRLPDRDAASILPDIRNLYPVIVLTGYGSIPNAVSAIREGAADFLTKPVNLDEFELTVRRVLETAELRDSNRFYRTQLASFRPGPMVFASPAMHEVQVMIDAVAPTDTTVLILGESGTGKELVAQAIHERSLRSSRELVAIDSNGLQDNLFESELFGHERGAFTGANQQKKGLIEEAKMSSLFLDEIGDIGPSIQAKLLRVMESGTFRRLGGNKTLSADVRFIAATNRDLAKMSSLGEFRSDLYFRLSPFVITIPPLRERREDIAPLAQHFLARFSRSAPMTLTTEALRMLVAYDWPGNVRELRNTIERAVILTRPGNQVRAQNLSFLPSTQPGETLLRFNEDPTLEQIEREYLYMTLAKYGENRLKTAAVLGISERQVYRLIEKYR